ncbi:S41 family peptidase [Agriterribacter sp.]|uniref:S41 family peptidase n=1 Tax=Agriterribacter sp. TaxID=2821509 RepID=UPI002C25EC2C|nr:S41 family peptidase [Agriterribacter sp.]HRO47020.1 S41 family peptidase [Agriterribacter sp.]HRQ17828.1 S41 family peptidase [Agriterribacter sp.]
MELKNIALFFFSAVVLSTVGCKKENNNGDAGNTTENRVKDTAWSYAKDLYLWHQNLPSDFNARSYADPDAIMKALRPYSAEPGFADPVDRWSFAIKKAEWDDVSLGISGDFGLGIFFMSENDLRVSYVEPASPAAAAGIERSWQIMSVNNNTTVNTDDATISRISTAVFNSSSASFTFKKPDGTDVDITLTAATHQDDPIILDTVYSNGGNKTGYFVFNSFLGNIDNIKSRLGNIFNAFSAAGINDMIVDLRYNGGGYVALQNELANYLVPSSGNNGIMLQEKFNNNYSALFDTTINYQKKGALNLNRIFFIITKNTASASELLINSLKPYVDVKLIGRASHGKPVGYFNIGVGDWYIFPVSFRSVNKNGEGNYFNGLQPDVTVDDGLDKPWGDINESCLASALHYINEGAFSRISARAQQDIRLENGNTALDIKRFKGAVEERSRTW